MKKYSDLLCSGVYSQTARGYNWGCLQMLLHQKQFQYLYFSQMRNSHNEFKSQPSFQNNIFVCYSQLSEHYLARNGYRLSFSSLLVCYEHMLVESWLKRSRLIRRLVCLNICEVLFGWCFDSHRSATCTVFYASIYQITVILRSTQRSLSGMIHMWLSQSGTASDAADVCKVPFRREAAAAVADADLANVSSESLSSKYNNMLCEMQQVAWLKWSAVDIGKIWGQ